MAMQPIRWDNVNGGSIGDASRILDSAGQSIGSVFDKLGGLLQQREAIDQSNWLNTKANNTLDNRAALMKIANAGDYEAAQKSGQIDSILGRHGYQVDRGALMDFADNRLNTLRQRDVQGITYNHAMTDEAQAPLRDQIAGYLASGDKNLIAKGQAMLADAQLRQKADLYGNARDASRQLVDWDHKDKDFILSQDKGRAEITHMRNQDANSAASLALQREGLGIQRAQMYQSFMDHAEQQLAKNQQLKQGLNPVTAASEEGGKLIKDALIALKDPAAQRNIGEGVAEFIAKNPNVPASAIAAGIATTNQRWYRSDSHIRGEVLDNIAGLASAAQADNSSKSKEAARLLATETDLRLRNRIDGFQQQAYASLDPKAAATRLKADVSATAPRKDQNGQTFVPVPEGTAPAYVRPAPASQPAGQYGPNGWEPLPSAPAADVKPAMPNDFNSMTPAQREARWNAQHAPAIAAQQLAEAASRQKQIQANASQIPAIEKNLNVIAKAKAAGQMVDPNVERMLRQRLKELRGE